jgi:hypothetical protein
MQPARTGEDVASDHSQSDLTGVAMTVAVGVAAAAAAAAVRQLVRRDL